MGNMLLPLTRYSLAPSFFVASVFLARIFFSSMTQSEPASSEGDNVGTVDLNPPSRELQKYIKDATDGPQSSKMDFVSLEHLKQLPWPDAAYIQDARKRILSKKGFIIDMDGVIYRGDHLLPGVNEFVAWLHAQGKRFVFLTNSSDKTPDELQRKLARLGVAHTANFYTSAMATAAFLASQRPKGSAYVIGDPGLHQALYSVGYVRDDVNPDYVVVGETRNYNYETIQHAVHLVLNGAKLIGTNCDKTDPSPDYPGEVIPAAGSLITPIEKASGVNAYFVGKPNPLMMRSALSVLGTKRLETVIIGDRMDTDILGGIEAEIDSVLVLSGVTTLKDTRQWSFLPRFIMRGIFDLVQK